MTEEDIFDGYGIRVKLKQPNDFLKVRETLTRIGLDCSRGDKKILVQSCHILHKRGQYAIIHFKELFLLDGKEAVFSEEDMLRTKIIAKLLADWKLVELVDEVPEDLGAAHHFVSVIPYKDKKDWELRSKYTIGSNKKGTQGNIP